MNTSSSADRSKTSIVCAADGRTPALVKRDSLGIHRAGEAYVETRLERSTFVGHFTNAGRPKHHREVEGLHADIIDLNTGLIAIQPLVRQHNQEHGGYNGEREYVRFQCKNRRLDPVLIYERAAV